MGGLITQDREVAADANLDVADASPCNDVENANASRGLVTAATTMVKESVSAQPDHGRALLASNPSTQHAAIDDKRSEVQRTADVTQIPA